MSISGTEVELAMIRLIDMRKLLSDLNPKDKVFWESSINRAFQSFLELKVKVAKRSDRITELESTFEDASLSHQDDLKNKVERCNYPTE